MGIANFLDKNLTGPINDLITRISGGVKANAPETNEFRQPSVTTERPDIDFLNSKIMDLDPLRMKKYIDYDEMDSEIIELSAALDIHADYLVSSQSDTQDLYSVEFDDSVGMEMPNKIVTAMEDDIHLKDRIWFISRGMIKYGDAFYEIVVDGNQIVKFKPISAYEMFLNYNANNEIIADAPYIQRSRAQNKVVATFAPWEITHFKIGDEDYGVDYSIFAHLRRTYRIERMLEDTLVVTRIARANQRGVWKVDVTGMSETEAARYLNKLKLINSRKFQFSSEGKLKTGLDALAPQEDIYIGVRKDGIGGDFVVVGGESHLGEIRDVEHFHNKLFAGTKVPKALLGFEGDVNSKATLAQQNIAFTKIVKRHRFALSEALRKLYKINFILHGVDPNAFGWKIKFPSLGSVDEEMKWSIENTKAAVIAAYKGSLGINIPNSWIIKKLMLGLSSEESEELTRLVEEEDQKIADKAKQAAEQQAAEAEAKAAAKAGPPQGAAAPASGLSPQPQPENPAIGPPSSESKAKFYNRDSLESLARDVAKDKRLTQVIKKAERELVEALRRRGDKPKPDLY